MSLWTTSRPCRPWKHASCFSKCRFSVKVSPNSETRLFTSLLRAQPSLLRLFALYATMVLAVADSYFQVGGRTPTVL